MFFLIPRPILLIRSHKINFPSFHGRLIRFSDVTRNIFRGLAKLSHPGSINAVVNNQCWEIVSNKKYHPFPETFSRRWGGAVVQFCLKPLGGGVPVEQDRWTKKIIKMKEISRQTRKRSLKKYYCLRPSNFLGWLCSSLLLTMCNILGRTISGSRRIRIATHRSSKIAWSKSRVEIDLKTLVNCVKYTNIFKTNLVLYTVQYVSMMYLWHRSG